jgi:molecular chaperone DnaK
MAKAIGIDLGAKNTVAAIRTGEGLRVIQSSEGEDVTPSVVGTYKNRLRVGRPALDLIHLAPCDTITSVKRLMGRAYNDELVQKVRTRCPYEVVPADDTDEDVRVIMAGKAYSPEEVSAEVLKKIKSDAESWLNDAVEYAVITVPAYFNEKQKAATMLAGGLAGFKGQKILIEPIAAAIAFGAEKSGNDSKTILVYDLSSATFDVSMLTSAGGRLVLQHIDGDMWLGGYDFDRFRAREHAMNSLWEIALSDMIRTDVHVAGVLKDEEGNFIDVNLELSRSEFEGIIKSRVAATLELVRKSILRAAMSPEQIDSILMVGGSSRLPSVWESLREMFGDEKVLADIDPTRCVAYGAALFAARVSWEGTNDCRD